MSDLHLNCQLRSGSLQIALNPKLVCFDRMLSVHGGGY